MLATSLTNKNHSLGIGREPRRTTYIPSPFILLLAIESGWKVANIKLAPSEDQLGLVFIVTLKSDSFQPDQELVLPKNTLVEKILAEHSQLIVCEEAGSLN